MINLIEVYTASKYWQHKQIGVFSSCFCCVCFTSFINVWPSYNLNFSFSEVLHQRRPLPVGRCDAGSRINRSTTRPPAVWVTSSARLIEMQGVNCRSRTNSMDFSSTSATAFSSLNPNLKPPSESLNALDTFRGLISSGHAHAWASRHKVCNPHQTHANQLLKVSAFWHTLRDPYFVVTPRFASPSLVWRGNF